MADLSTTFNDIGGAVSDLFGASGSTASATSYSQAATIAEANAQIAKESTALQEVQASRQVYQTIGGQKAAIAGAGLSAGGTSLDLLRSSASQGALTKAILANQGAITENSYAEQAGLYEGLSGAASSSAEAQTAGGVIQGIGAVASIASDVGGIGDAIGDVVSALSWIVCTELHRQGKMSSRLYYSAAPAFLKASERAKRGYYLWAIPSTKHLRKHPDSWYSKLLEKVFNCRARHIFNVRHKNKTTLSGSIVTHGIYVLCWILGWFVPKKLTDWKVLYA